MQIHYITSHVFVLGYQGWKSVAIWTCLTNNDRPTWTNSEPLLDRFDDSSSKDSKLRGLPSSKSLDHSRLEMIARYCKQFYNPWLPPSSLVSLNWSKGTFTGPGPPPHISLNLSPPRTAGSSAALHSISRPKSRPLTAATKSQRARRRSWGLF